MSQMSVITIFNKDIKEMGILLLEAPFIRDPQGTSRQSVENPQLLGREMVGTSMNILLRMSFLAKHSVGEGTILIPRDNNIKEREETIDFLFLSELDGR